MTEEEIAKDWIARAKREGHRPGLPPVPSDYNGMCQPNRGRPVQMNDVDLEVFRLLDHPMIAVEIVNELKFYTESAVWNSLKRMERRGEVAKGPVVTKYGRAMRTWIRAKEADDV